MYKFTDTTETSGGIWLSSEAVSLDGKLIEDYVDGYHTLAVSGRESLEFEIDDEDRPTGVNGMNYFGKRMKGRELEVTFQLIASSADELMARFRKLVNFVKGENRQIRFADEPAAHYTGTIETLDAPDAGKLQITSKMKFYCPDPALESDVTTTVAITADDSGILRKTFNYDGSATAYPTYRITHNSDNGYIGIAATTGSFEMGNIDEDDKQFIKSEYFKKTGEECIGALDAVESCPLNTSMKCSCTIDFPSKEAGLGVGNTGSADSSSIDGLCAQWELGSDVNNKTGAESFYLSCPLTFVIDNRNTTAMAGVYVTDENKKIFAGYQILKKTKGNTIAQYEMKVGDDSTTNPTLGVWRTFKFDCSSKSKNNPFSPAKGDCELTKIGDTIRFYYNGKYYDYKNSSLSSKKAYYVFIYLGKRAGSAGWPNQLWAFSRNRGVFRKDNVNGWEDIPNLFCDGSEVTINTKTDEIKVDNMLHNDLLVTGSVFPELRPGTNGIEIQPSSWCEEMPTVTVEYRKRWL